MNRPLIITDCDEVLLHMIIPFRQWLDETHAVHFDVRGQDFTEALRHKDSDILLERKLVWELLVGFFDTEMHRQTPFADTIDVLRRLSADADIVCLTNIGERHQQARAEQLAGHDLPLPVYWNHGGKGPQLAEIIAAHAPSVTLFIDDLGEHHASVEQHAPDVWRLHMIGEPEVAAHVPSSRHAHARIDDWASAESWIAARLADGPAPHITTPHQESIA